MNAQSAKTPAGFISETPKQAPSSIQLSPPPLKQNRLPRHIAIPIEGEDCKNGPLGSSSLISIMHGHDVTTPRDFSHAPEMFLVPPLAEKEDFVVERSITTNAKADEIADFEVAMLSSVPRGFQARPSDQRLSSATAQSRVATRMNSAAASRPYLPANSEFTESTFDRPRFALLPKINLFREKF